MAEKIRVGHVGAGWMGVELLEKLVEHPDVEVAGAQLGDRLPILPTVANAVAA